MPRSITQKENRRSAKTNRKLADLYQTDETAWLEKMSRLIQERRYNELDYKDLAEFLRDMAMRDRREVMSRLATLMMHVLKWQYQPRKRSRSWEITIVTQQDDLRDLLESRALEHHANEVLSKAYRRAVRYAATETGLAEDRFPQACPFSLTDLLGRDWIKTL